eukprot:GHVR01062966.1.p1 GENE.GHVR01062966.1~~GHVR01062966.1.p1  ORF type:complete len:109 (+),score=0.30 GHVR01062966.1:2993-3319(+)
MLSFNNRLEYFSLLLVPLNGQAYIKFGFHIYKSLQVGMLKMELVYKDHDQCSKVFSKIYPKKIQEFFILCMLSFNKNMDFILMQYKSMIVSLIMFQIKKDFKPIIFIL